MALAFHEPGRIRTALQTPRMLKEQAAALGLETEPWFEPG